jgi:adenylate cyclase class IV
MANDGREIEIKLHVADLNALRTQLRRLGAKATPRRFERNILYDTPASELRETGRLLRIRIETPVSGRRTLRDALGKPDPPRASHAQSRGILTYKAPSIARYRRRFGIAIQSKRKRSKSNIIPLRIWKPSSRQIGLRPGFRYEKFRTSYRLRRFPGSTSRPRRDSSRQLSGTRRLTGRNRSRRVAPWIFATGVHHGKLLGPPRRRFTRSKRHTGRSRVQKSKKMTRKCSLCLTKRASARN